MDEGEIKSELRELKNTIDRMDRTLNGDSTQQGMRTRIALLERWVQVAGKLLWLMITAAAMSAGSAVVIALQALFQ